MQRGIGQVWIQCRWRPSPVLIGDKRFSGDELDSRNKIKIKQHTTRGDDIHFEKNMKVFWCNSLIVVVVWIRYDNILWIIHSCRSLVLLLWWLYGSIPSWSMDDDDLFVIVTNFVNLCCFLCSSSYFSFPFGFSLLFLTCFLWPCGTVAHSHTPHVCSFAQPATISASSLHRNGPFFFFFIYLLFFCLSLSECIIISFSFQPSNFSLSAQQWASKKENSSTPNVQHNQRTNM